MSFVSLLTHTCNLQTNTPTQDSSGQLIESWANTLTSLACRLEPIGGGLIGTPTAIYESATHTLFLRKPAAPALTTKNQRIVIGGENYTILLVQELYASKLVNHLEIILAKVT